MHVLPHYWLNSFIERMLSEADNEQKSKPTRSNPSSAPPDAADGRRRKGTDYSTAATGGSSASLDNEDFERCRSVRDYTDRRSSILQRILITHASHVVLNAMLCLASSTAC